MNFITAEMGTGMLQEKNGVTFTVKQSLLNFIYPYLLCYSDKSPVIGKTTLSVNMFYIFGLLLWHTSAMVVSVLKSEYH